LPSPGPRHGRDPARRAAAGADDPGAGMSLVAAVVVPAAPALLPGIGGAADPLGGLRDRARRLVRATLADAKAGPLLLVIGSGRTTRTWPVVAPSGAPRFTTGRVPEGALPPALEIGRELAPPGAGEPALRSIAADAGPTECLALGRQLEVEGPAVLVIVADGPATLTEKAPGHLQPDADPFAAGLSRVLDDG